MKFRKTKKNICNVKYTIRFIVIYLSISYVKIKIKNIKYNQILSTVLKNHITSSGTNYSLLINSSIDFIVATIIVISKSSKSSNDLGKKLGLSL